jgi:hypothetical protein
MSRAGLDAKRRVRRIRAARPDFRSERTRSRKMQGRNQQPRAQARAIEMDEVIPGVGRPKALFLLAAGLSFVMSVYLFFTGSHEQGIFVGIWVPSILSAGALMLGGNGHD